MRKMLCLIVAGLVAVVVLAGDAVEPNSCTFTNFRGEAVVSVPVGTIYRSTSLVFTNCVLYSGTTTNAAVQGLDGCTVQVSVGDLSTNTDYTATVTSTNLGKWGCAILIPDMATFLIQVKVTDGQTNSYVYPSKSMSAEQSMF